MSKFYLKDWGRPFGLEEEIFTERPNEDLPEECPFGFTVLEYDTRAEAEAVLMELSPTYRKLVENE